MTSNSVRVPVLNSLVFVRDARIHDIPEIDGDSPILSTPSCVAVGCLPDCDGETEITIGAAKDIQEAGLPAFDGQLETPSGSVIVETVLSERLLQASVPTSRTRVRIWTNGLPDTDKVVIGLG
jgi:hypothetical protein